MSETVAEMAAGGVQRVGQSTNETFTRNQRLGLLGIAVAAYALTALAAEPIGFFIEEGFGASLALDPAASTALIKAGIWTVLIGVAATFAGRGIRPDVGVFAACIALLAIRRIGGTSGDVYLHHSSAGAMRGLALELLLLGLILAAVHAISRLMVARGLMPDDAGHDSIRPKPEHLSQKLIAGGATALTVGMGVLIICRSDERMQITIGLAVSGLVASLCAVRFIPATPSVWFWAGPVLMGIVGYLIASVSPGATIVIGEPSGYAPALVRPLPLDYASAGVAGALYGYWLGRGLIPEDALESDASENRRGPVG